MPRYILIDNCMGVIYGDVLANSPIEASKIIDDSNKVHGRRYTEQNFHFGYNYSTCGYHVYEAPSYNDYPSVNDGTDQKTIDEVSKFPKVSFVEIDEEIE